MLHLATKEDFVEDLYLAIRELVEHHGASHVRSADSRTRH
jgi:hypothetical protein